MPSAQAPLPMGPYPTSQVFRSHNNQEWGLLFKKQVERCWKKPTGSGLIEAIFSLRLMRDGTVEAVQLINGSDVSAYGKAYQASCLRAIMDCQPYDLPQAAYDEWRFFEPVFTERRR